MTTLLALAATAYLALAFGRTAVLNWVHPEPFGGRR